jgi:hypothetical protein
MQEIDRAAAVRSYSGVIGDESDPLAGDQVQGVAEQYFDAKADPTLRGQDDGPTEGGQNPDEVR